MQRYLIPRKGLIVRDPSSFSPLPKDGMLVDWNGNAGRFWRRRVKCGDASIVIGKDLEELLKKLAEQKKKLEKEASSETTSNRRQRSK